MQKQSAIYGYLSTTEYMKFRHPFIFLLMIVLPPILSGCVTTPDNSAMKTITGEIVFDEYTSLPESSQVTVSLEDISGLDAASGVMVVKEFNPAGPPPYRFSLEYNSNWMNPSREYVVRVRIDVDGKFTYTGNESIDAEKKQGVLPVRVERVDYSE